MLALSALDMALWDLVGKIEGKPCWQLLGGATNREITPYASLLPDGDDLDTYGRVLRERAVAAQSLGFRAAKLEIPVALGKDIAGEPQIIDLVQTPHLLIAGATGSGKSTMLKCLAGIYGTDAGEIYIRGRLSSFIELGVGFNPDLPARDNVGINATMLGLSPKEGRRRFDAIIDFAELIAKYKKKKKAGAMLFSMKTSSRESMAYTILITNQKSLLSVINEAMDEGRHAPNLFEMIINALNSGASVYMADFEDSHAPTWAATGRQRRSTRRRGSTSRSLRVCSR